MFVIPSLRRAASLLWLAAALLATLKAQAQTPASAEYRLDFEGTADCRNEEELEREIRARVPQAVINNEAPTEVVVRIEQRDAGPHARLTIRARRGSTEREIDGVDCATVLRGLALMIAVHFDEHGTPPPPPPPPPKPKPKPKIETKSTGTTDNPDPKPKSPPATNRLGLVGGGEARTGAAAVLLTSGQLGAQWRVEKPEGWFAPTIRILGSYGVGPISTNVGSPWDFRLRLVRAVGCPVRYVASPTLRWHACAVFEVGQLDASGAVKIDPGGVVKKTPGGVKLSDLAAPQLLWIGAGATIAVEFALGRRVGLELALTSVVVGKRARFVEASPTATQLNEVPRASVGLSLTALTWIY